MWNSDTIAVISKQDSSLIGYTDNITIAPAKSGVTPPAGTSAQLVTIPAPTSTNYDASVGYTGNIPSPTAVTGQTSSSTSPAASGSQGSSSQSSGGASSASGASQSLGPSESASAAGSPMATIDGSVGSSAAQSAAPSSTSPTSAGTLQQPMHIGMLLGFTVVTSCMCFTLFN